jgi:tryptophanyl-tRNA synthetase
MMSEQPKPVVLTCAQPTGQLHLGNYLGAVKNWVALQADYECYFGIVDLHAITMPYVPAQLRANSLGCLAQYLACGLDPERSHLFLQSQVRGHTELAWVLGCLAPLGKLERMTQFKDKSTRKGTVNEADQQEGFVGAGLLTYPVLMAADILIYNADRVPVGEDQKQHLELTRDLAVKFNATYSPTFKVPDVDIPKSAARVMSLQDPSRKMSKSDPNQNGCLYLMDEPAVLRKKVMSAVTDSDPDKAICVSPQKPGISNLLAIYGSLSGTSAEAAAAQFKDATYADFKAAVADRVTEQLAPVRERYLEFKDDKKYLKTVLAEGADAAQRRAGRTLSKVWRKAGFLSAD